LSQARSWDELERLICPDAPYPWRRHTGKRNFWSWWRRSLHGARLFMYFGKGSGKSLILAFKAFQIAALLQKYQHTLFSIYEMVSMQFFPTRSTTTCFLKEGRLHRFKLDHMQECRAMVLSITSISVYSGNYLQATGVWFLTEEARKRQFQL